MSTVHDALDPIDAETSPELYLDHKQSQVAEATLRYQRYRLGRYLRWSEERRLHNLSDLPGRLTKSSGCGASGDGYLSQITLRANMGTLRVSLE